MAGSSSYGGIGDGGGLTPPSPFAQQQSAPLYRRPFVLPVLFIVFLHSAAVALVLAPLTDLVAFVYKSDLQAAALFLSVLEAIVAALQFATDPLWGHLSDTTMGRRPPLLVAVLQFAAEMFLLYLWPSWWSLVVMAVLRGICGVGFTLCSILLMDLAGACSQLGPRLLGLYGAASGAGFVIGALSGVLVGRHNLGYPFLLAGIVEVVNAIFIVSVLPSHRLVPLEPEELEPEAQLVEEELPFEEAGEDDTPTKSVSPPMPMTPAHVASSTFRSEHTSHNPFVSLQILVSSPELCWLSLAFFLGFLGRAYTRIFFVYTRHALGWTAEANGLFLAFMGSLAILAQGAAMRPVLKFLGETKALYMALTLNALAALGFALLPRGTPGAWILYFVSAATCLSALLLPLLRSLMSREVAAHSQGLLGGAASSVVTAANLVGSGLYGPLFAYFTAGERAHGAEPAFPGLDQPSADVDVAPSMPRLGGAPFDFAGAPFVASLLVYLLAYLPIKRALDARAESRRRRKQAAIDEAVEDRRREDEQQVPRPSPDLPASATRAYQEDDPLLGPQRSSS